MRLKLVIRFCEKKWNFRVVSGENKGAWAGRFCPTHADLVPGGGRKQIFRNIALTANVKVAARDP